MASRGIFCVPSPPVARPEVCVSRSRIVIAPIGRDELDVRFLVLSTATFIALNSGMNFETGSSSRIFPSSISIITATPVTGLVEEAMRNEGVRAHRPLRVEVHQAVGLEMHHGPPAADQRDGPGDPMLVDVAADHVIDPMESLGREADVFRLRPGQRVIRRDGRGRRQHRQGQAREEDPLPHADNAALAGRIRESRI